MSVKITLPNGTKIECDTPEEADRIIQLNPSNQSKKKCSEPGCSDTSGDPHCGCGGHHYGMC